MKEVSEAVDVRAIYRYVHGRQRGGVEVIAPARLSLPDGVETSDDIWTPDLTPGRLHS